jgi:hypothetical protein
MYEFFSVRFLTTEAMLALLPWTARHWLKESGATDHLVKENMPVISKYKLSFPTKIHIAKNNNYLLAYEKGDVIAETYVNGELDLRMYS